MEAYGSDSDFQAWLTAQGLTLPAGANLTAMRTIGKKIRCTVTGTRPLGSVSKSSPETDPVNEAKK